MKVDLRHLQCSGSSDNKLLSILFILLISISISFISGCGQSGSDISNSNADGTLVVGLTDAEGDFVSYIVDVQSITLTKANGRVVQVLPVTSRVDFARYTELTEFVTSSMVPLGAYRHVTMTLDYSNADIRVENSLGDAVAVDAIQDEAGNSVTTLEMTVHLEGRNKLVISKGVPAHLTLDFDLNTSNKAVFNSDGIPTVIVEPYLVADVDLQRPKTHRLRGSLQEVDVDNSSFDILVQPFHRKLNNDELFGTLTVLTDDETIYDIDNQSYVGSPGLLALDVLPLSTPTIVHGN